MQRNLLVISVVTKLVVSGYISYILWICNYRPQRSCGQGYVFTRVCDSVCRRETPRQGDPPTPRQGDPSGRENSPGKEAPWAGRPPWQGGPPARQGDTPLARRPPRQGEPPWQGEPPPRQGGTPRHTVNERPVRILLECILVAHFLKLSYPLLWHQNFQHLPS